MEFDAQKIIDEHGGKCKTRKGTDVMIYAFHPDIGNEFKVHGAYQDGRDGWRVGSWTPEGEHYGQGQAGSPFDLIMPRTIVAIWINELTYGGPGQVVVRTTLYSDHATESEIVS